MNYTNALLKNTQGIQHNTNKRIFCTNCGNSGHLQKNCTEPIISAGIIAVKLTTEGIKYALVCRKQSFAFIDFLREKYSLHDFAKLRNMFDNMTISEKQSLLTEDIELITRKIGFDSLFPRKDRTVFAKYDELKNGVSYGLEKYTLARFIQESRNQFNEPEWGFPKGRRDSNESDIDCALREYTEETGSNPKNIIILRKISPISEQFKGSNDYIYRYNYFIALALTDFDLYIDENNYEQRSEIGDIGWFTLSEALHKIRPIYTERKRILCEIENHSIFAYR